ncbi:hypothetical protein GIB67_010946 [Kingdonia uniflora]|uniref:F-box domain-containing protein n=1 Tax=Kingdonia uniflora TaxID=39325 RepID=A0A7J7NVZ2_9MAGN|nr:hypothetical protein GIB67_010946 [Kingdonia uniflora]
MDVLVSKPWKSGGSGDRISNLPDVVLHRIISLLPIKEAVATCVLSTQWKYLWISIDNLA